MPGLDANTKLLLHADTPEVHGFKDDPSALDFLLDATVGITSDDKKFNDHAFVFDGDSDLFAYAHANNDSFDMWDSTTDYWTVGLWLKALSDPADESTIISYGSDANNQWAIYVAADGNLWCNLKSGGSTYLNFGSSSGVDVYDTTAWHYVTLIKYQQEIGLYWDGDQVAYQQLSQAINLNHLSSYLYIGYGSNPAKYWHGYMDDIWIYAVNDYYSIVPDAGLTTSHSLPTEPIGHYNTTNLFFSTAYTGAFDSAKEHDPTWAGNYMGIGSWSIYGAPTRFKWISSFLFNGSSDKIEFADSADWDVVGSDADNWTIDLQVKHSDHAGNECYICQHEDANNYWTLQHVHATGLQFIVQSGGGALITCSGGEITDINWHHVAMCKVADEYGIYLDGTQVAYVQEAGDSDTFSGSLFIAAFSGSNWFAGHMDEIRIQASNYFNAAPNATPDDTIEVPTAAYDGTGSAGNSTQGIIL
ncbi:LamG-like jellyroll fold domain-containing protein [Candidatus Omnitrophota bacterium]